MEKWEEVYTKEQLERVQQIELMILKDFDQLCKKIGVKFFVYGGTLIGTVKYSGFVPWDDDIDVALMRSDYEKLINEGNNYCGDKYFIQSPSTDSFTPFSYSKFRLKGTQYIEKGYHRLKIEKGIYIDIYPIDVLPVNEDEYLKQFHSFKRLTKMYTIRQCPYSNNVSRGVIQTLKRSGRMCLSILYKVIPASVLMKRINKTAMRFNNQIPQRYGNLYYPKPVNYFDAIEPFEERNFEDLTVLIPATWEQHLNSRYGDYKREPDEGERLGHRPFILDFGKYQ